MPWKIELDSAVSFQDKNPSIDEYLKFVEWKVKDYKLSDSDKRIIEFILFYESEWLKIIDFNFYIYLLKTKDH